MSAPESHRLFFNEDRSKLVHEGDPDARFLAVANEEDPMPEGFKRPGRGSKPEATDTADADAKAAEKVANKQTGQAVNKAK